MRILLNTLIFTILNGQNSFAVIDSNADGISDVWVRAYQAEALAPDDDEDGDGMSNAEEALAGTDPFDPSSNLHPTQIRYVDSGVALEWQGADNHVFQLESQEALSAGGWLPKSGLLPGTTGRMLTVIPKPNDTTQFFRIASSQISPADIPSTQGLLHDTDGDGHSDLTEFLVKTDIFDPNSSPGITDIVAGRLVVIDWNAVPGKRYQVQALAPGSLSGWADFGRPQDSGLAHKMTISEPAPAPGTQFRIVPSDIDSDGDGASDWEEWAVGYDPQRAITYTGTQTDNLAIQQILQDDIHYDLISRRSTVLTTGSEPGLVEIRRTTGFGPIKPLVSITGTAAPGIEYVALNEPVAIPLGAKSVKIPIVGLPSARDKTKLLISVGTPKPRSNDSASTSVNFVTPVIISVRDHGAVGDGITDDTMAIQSALDALEANPTLNTLHFPTGKYRITRTYYHSLTGFTNYRMLQFGFNDLSGRDIFFTGDPGSVLFSDTGTFRTHMLMVQASFRSFSCSGLTWEKASTPLSVMPAGYSPNGADGISIVPEDGRKIEGITFDNCVFTNCHASISVYSNSYDYRASIRCLAIRDSQILNPYGSNTLNSRLAWGGGQQVLVSPWVGTAIYSRNLFDGGGDDLTDQTTSPGGRLKDGCHFGSPQRLEFTHNTVRQMAVEAIFQTATNTYLGSTTTVFVMPPADGITTIEVNLDQPIASLVPGDFINLRVPTTNTKNGANNLFKLIATDLPNQILTLVNEGFTNNAAEGALISGYQVVSLASEGTAAEVEISNNWVDYLPPPGASPEIWSAGIVANARSRISNNTVTGMQLGILIYREAPSPVSTPSRWSQIKDNFILTRNSANHPESSTYGIQSFGHDVSITGNFVITPSSYRVGGIVTRGRNSWIECNSVISMSPADNGYNSRVRSVAFGVGNTSSGATFCGNSSFGFDVGVGPADPNQSIPHWIKDHRSVQDILPIDPRGVISR